jgi:hypothetical protein
MPFQRGMSEQWLSQKYAKIQTIPNFESIVHPHLTKFYRGAGSPLAVAPISVSSINGSNLPLNSGRNAASVYGQRTDGEPL